MPTLIDVESKLTQPFVSGPLPGPKALALLQKQRDYESTGVSYPKRFPLAPGRAFDCWIEDVDGNVFLDFTSMAGVVTLGHQSSVIDEFFRCARQLTTTLDFPTEARTGFIEALALYLTEALGEPVKTHLTAPTGSDAVEAALKLCRYQTKRTTVISFSGSYHGTSTGAAAVSDLPRQKLLREPLDTVFVPYPNCYRCPAGLRRDDCSLQCADEVQRAIESRAGGEAAVSGAIIEPVQGEGGTIPLPPGYLERIQNLLHDAGSLLIADEVQSGFGRTGRLFGFEHTAARPDIVVFSKGVSGVGAPMAGIAFKASLDGWPTGAHIGTFRGFVPAFASAILALEILTRTPLLRDVRMVSATVSSALAGGLQGCDWCGDVRASGFMFGIEIVADRSTRTPDAVLTDKIAQELFCRGIVVEIGGPAENVIRLLPPLTTPPDVLIAGVRTVIEIIRNGGRSRRETACAGGPDTPSAAPLGENA